MATPQKVNYILGTGRRKSAVARIRLKDGAGKIVVNGRELDRYFVLGTERDRLTAPLRAVSAEKGFDVLIKVSGGGMTAQSGASSLGIARALLKANPEFEPILRSARFLTRDSRQKERKKYGRRGARRGFQFSKR